MNKEAPDNNEKKRERDIVLLHRLRFFTKIRSAFWGIFLVWLLIIQKSSTTLNRIASISFGIALGLDCMFLLFYLKIMERIKKDYY